MEILKFEDSEKSLSSKKPFGRGTILVAFIALVFGAGTALAGGTLSINDTNTIALDQGVATTVTCDDDGQIDVSLISALNTYNPDNFVLSSVKVTGLLGDIVEDTCVGKQIKIMIYGEDTSGISTPLEFCTPGIDVDCNGDGTEMTRLYDASPIINFNFSPTLNTDSVKRVTVVTE